MTKVVIVPLDFSETSLNAAQYAADMYKNREDIQLVLYHFYKKEDEIESAKNNLNEIKERLAASCANIEMQVESGNDFIDSLAKYAHVRTAYML